jgi:putative salt-induced outer membrane protein YdiY
VRIRLLFLLLLPLASALLADQVVLKNGDTITGSIVKKDGDKLTIKSEFLGDVTMPWSAVRSIRSDEALTVELPGNERVAGKIATSGETLEVTTTTTTRSAPLAQVGALRNPAEQRTWERLQHPGLLELWTGFFDTGFALARGNARTDTLTTGFNASRVTRKDKLTLTFSQIYGKARVNGVTSEIANALRGGWSYNHNVSERLFVSTMNDYEHDSFLGLDLRMVFGAGLGANLIKTPNTSLAFIGAADYNRENFINNVSRNSAELNFGNDFLHKFSPTTSVTQSLRIFPNLSETGEYRVAFDLGAVTALKKWLGWHVTASDRFLSNPLFGRQRNDLILSTGLRISFAK